MNGEITVNLEAKLKKKSEIKDTDITIEKLGIECTNIKEDETVAIEVNTK